MENRCGIHITVKVKCRYKKGKYLNGCKEKIYEIHKYISLCGIKAGNVLDSILNYFSVHD